jgi:DNA-dependent RNA polymerase auxiliary subunit epsilon
MVKKTILALIVCTVSAFSQTNVDENPVAVKKFANIMTAIDGLNKRLQKEVTSYEGAMLEEKIAKIRTEFKEKSLNIIFLHGLSLDEYLDYTKKFQTDEVFKEKVLSAVSKR